jgi:hypothetical protein
MLAADGDFPTGYRACAARSTAAECEMTRVTLYIRFAAEWEECRVNIP